MNFPQHLIRFLFCFQLFFGLLFSTSFSKVTPFGDSFNYWIHAIVLLNLFIHIRYFAQLKMSVLIFIFTFLSSFVNGFEGLRLGMIYNFLTFSAIEIALVANTFSDNKAYFNIYYYAYGIVLGLSMFLIIIGVNTQPFTGMYMAQKISGIPVQIWGLFSDKNIFGFSAMLFFLISLLLPDFKHRKKIIIASFITIVLSGNRSGLLTVCITLIFLYLLKPEYSLGKKISVAFKAGILVAILILLYVNSPFNTRGLESNDRDYLYSIAYSYISNHFWFGIGRALIVGGEMVHTHNLYIQVMAEEGFFCLVIYLMLFMKVLIKGSYSTKILCLATFIFTGFNPILVPGQLFSITALILVGRHIDKLRAEEKNLITNFEVERQVELNIIR